MPWRRVAYRAIRPLLFASTPRRSIARPSPRCASRAPAGLGAGWRGLAGGASLARSGRLGRGAGCGSAIGWGSARASTRMASPCAAGRRSGLGFVEVGTVTRCRRAAIRGRACFACRADEALDQPDGLQQCRRRRAGAHRHAGAPPRLPAGFVVGVNIGRNAAPRPTRHDSRLPRGVPHSSPPVADYWRGQRQLAEHARPARPPAAGSAARAARRPARGRRAGLRPAVRCFVKLAPDLEPDDFAALVLTAVRGRATA